MQRYLQHPIVCGNIQDLLCFIEGTIGGRPVINFYQPQQLSRRRDDIYTIGAGGKDIAVCIDLEAIRSLFYRGPFLQVHTIQ